MAEMGLLWPIHPQPQPDELLSSWMIRLAHANRFKVHSFYARFFGRERQVWTRDIDHFAPPWLLQGLSLQSGVSIERLEKLTLRHLESIVFERFNEKGGTRWVMPLSVYHRTRRAYGQQYCPICLYEDTVPYLRWHWRLALMAVCAAHEVLLEDRCLACHRPLAPHRIDTARNCAAPAYHLPIHQCAYCRCTLARASARSVTQDTGWQTYISNVIAAGHAVIAGRPVYSHLYFDGLRFIMSGLHRAHGVGRAAVFERLLPGERAARLREAIQLTQSWPDEFLAKCASLPRPYTLFAMGRSDMPWWLASVLTEHVRQTPAPLSPAEAKAIVSAVSGLSGACTAHAARRFSGRDISRLLMPQTVSDILAAELIARLDAEMRVGPRSNRRILLRDKTMFLMARALHLNVSQLLAMRVSRQGRVKKGDGSLLVMSQLAHVARDSLQSYLRAVRPTLLGAADEDSLFISMNGVPLGRSAVGMRFSRAVYIAGLQDVVPGWLAWVRGQSSASE
ncbi:TniQ family protein [Ralstonia sp. SM1876_UCD536_TZ33]|uniref:TniQ family protein n=2 Tax=Ralstonia pseudosolanacearum TaxID=1310165 RepID=UPI003399D061